MAKYRKKPVVVEAMQWTEETWVDVLKWVTGELLVDHIDGQRCLRFLTIHGVEVAAHPGDWVVTTPKPGRYCLCPPGVFAASYEPVEG